MNRFSLRLFTLVSLNIILYLLLNIKLNKLAAMVYYVVGMADTGPEEPPKPTARRVRQPQQPPPEPPQQQPAALAGKEH